jgi:mono/diheme cytochrome c family protein
MRTIVAVVAIALVAGGCTTSQDNLFGEDLYMRSCAICHDRDGTGGVGFDIGRGSNTDLNLTDEQIAGVITVGPGNMPGFSRLSAEQVDSLVRYVRSLSD